jgi:FMN-dependent NADH-azoreductase
MKLLHLDTSILGPNSVSRKLTAEIVEREKALHPGLEIIYRDLESEKTLHLSGAHLAALHGTPVENAALGVDLAVGNAYMEELLSADIIVIGLPMYNFSIPSQLKGWIDRVSVAGKTFHYTANGPEGLVKGKKIIIASTRGGIYSSDSPMARFEHHESYVTAVLGFLGLDDISIVRAEGLAIGPENREAAFAKARQDIAALAA